MTSSMYLLIVITMLPPHLYYNRAHEIREPIEEELLPGNRLRCFHPIQPGDVLVGRFKTIARLGFSAGSTVWLAEDLNL